MSDTRPAVLGGRPAFTEKINIVKPYLPDMAAMEPGIARILATGMVTKGQYLQRFEEAVREHLGVRYAVAVSSCTTGMMLTHKGLGLTGEVVVPSFTFMATVSALVWAGLTPVFADVEAGTTNLSPAAAEAAITPRTSAIVAVHNFGNPAELDALQEIASKHHLRLILDAAHGFGACYQGQPVGAQGDAHIFSLSPTKLLIAGEGGIVATNDPELDEKIRTGREYGNPGNYDTAYPGFNARMPEINALMGINGLKLLEGAAVSRNNTVALVRSRLEDIPGLEFQEVRPGNRCSYKDLSIVVDRSKFGLDRDDLAQALAAENIDTRKYYQPPAHRQTAYRQYYHGQPLPATDALAEKSLSLPVWSHMPDDTAEGIALAICKIHENAETIFAKLHQ